MSCNRGMRRAAAAACRAGLPAAASRAAFFLGAWLLARLAVKTRRRWGKHVDPVPLAAPDRIKPIAAKALAGQSCRQCGAVSQDRGGLWYRVGGVVYCQPCAPEAARQAGAVLLGPGVSDAKSPLPVLVAGQTVLKPAQVQAGALSLAGYAVYVYGRDTALRLTRGGSVGDDQPQWFVVWGRSGQAIGGPFASIKEAEGLAGALTRLNWNRPIEEFSQAEIREAVRLAREYRGKTGR